MKRHVIRFLLVLGGIILVFAIYVRFFFHFDLMGLSERYDAEIGQTVGYDRAIAIPESATDRYEARWGFEDSSRVVTFRDSLEHAKAFAEAYAGKPIGEFTHGPPSLVNFELWRRAKNTRGYWRPEKVTHGLYLESGDEGGGWYLLLDEDTGTIFLVEFTT